MSVYWYGGTGNIDDFANHLSLNSGNSPAAPLGRVLNNTDDLVFDANSNTSATNYTVTWNVSAVCRDFTMGFTGTAKVIMAGSQRMTVYGNLDFVGGTSQITNNSTISFDWSPPVGTTKTIMSRGVGFKGQFIKNGLGTLQLLDDLLFNGPNGILNVNNGVSSFDVNGHKVSAIGVNSFSLGGPVNFVDLEFTPSSSSSSYMSMYSLSSYTVNISGTFTVKGYSTKSHTKVYGDYRYIHSLNAGAIVISNCDFYDLTVGGIADWDLSAQSDIGYVGGMSANFVPTPPVTTNLTNTTSCTWTTTATFSVRYPLPQDSVNIVGAFSANQTINMNGLRMCKNIDFSSCTGNPKMNITNNCEFYGSINITGCTPMGTAFFRLMGRGNETITCGGSIFTQTVSIQNYGVNGTYTIVDDFVSTDTTSWGSLVLNYGNLIINGDITLAGKFIKNYSGVFSNITDNGHTITCARANLVGGGGGTMTGKLIVTGTSATINDDGSVFCIGATTMNLINYTIEVADNTSAVKALKLATTSKIGKIELTGSGTMEFYTNAGVIGELKLSVNAILRLQYSYTFTVTTFTPLGAYTILSTSATTVATLAKAGGGRVSTDYGTFTKITGSPSHVWFAGSHGIDGGGNTYIYFYDIPANRGDFFDLLG